jgi:heat shock protein HslJ
MAVVATAVLACSPGDPEPDAGVPAPDSAAAVDPGAMPGAGMGPAADTSLGGIRWTLVELRGAPARSATPERAAYLELSPSEGRASGNTTCNRFSGPYSLSGDSLGFGALISTKMACVDSALNAQEVAFLGALQETRRWRMAGDTLVLASDSGDLARLLAGGGGPD